MPRRLRGKELGFGSAGPGIESHSDTTYSRTSTDHNFGLGKAREMCETSLERYGEDASNDAYENNDTTIIQRLVYE